MTQPIRVGIVGTGRISDLHIIEYMQNPKARVTALCDRNPELARQRAKAWGCEGVAIEEDFEKLLARNDVDLVELLLPHHLHLPAALKAIEAGKIISLQKPMTMNMEEANILVDAVESYDRPFKVFENFIFHPPVIKAKELIDQGAIGTPLSIRIKSNPGKSKTAWEIPWDVNAWRQEKDLSGGGPLVFDDGHHKFALAQHFMGNPEQVHAFIFSSETKDGHWFDAPSIISFSFPDNRIGNLEIVYSPELEISSNHYAQDDRVEITGSHGVIWINCGHGQIGNPAPVELYRDGKITEFRNIITNWEQSFVYSTRHFLEVLSNGGDPELTVQKARDVLGFAMAAEESALNGRPVTFKGE